jgi:DNA-binding MarR family transcriptional regulator
VTESHRSTLVRELLSAAREYSSAAVFLHATIASSIGLSVSDLKALDVLERSSTCTARDIASATGLTNSAVTALLDRLEKRRLICRSREAPDLRVVKVRLTAHFGRTVPRRFGSLEDRMVASCREYSDDELKTSASFLRGVAGALREELWTAQLRRIRGSAERRKTRTPAEHDHTTLESNAFGKRRGSPRMPTQAGRA